MSDWTPPLDKPLSRVNRCHQTDCVNDLHCFLKHQKRTTPAGTCITCGADLIDWARIHRRDLRDVEHTIGALKLERVRHEFWCTVALTELATNYAMRRGRNGLIEAARGRIRSAVGKWRGQWDGRQTAWEDKGDCLHYAQHATATCCRKCMEVWHGIPREDDLSASDIEYFAQLLMRYVVARIPDLSEEPVQVPRKVKALPDRPAQKAS